MSEKLKLLDARLKSALRRKFRRYDLVGQLKKLPPRPRNEKASKKVLFFSPRWWISHQAWEALLAESFVEQGYDPIFLTCGHLMTTCETYLLGVYRPGSVCGKCQVEMKDFLSTWGFTHRRLTEFVSPKEKKQILQIFKETTVSQLKEISYEGVYLWGLAEASMQRYFLAGEIPATQENREVLARFLASTALALQACKRMLKEISPDFIVMVNGSFFPEKTLSRLAEEAKIPYVTYERGKRRDTLLFAKNEPVILHRLDSLWEKAKDTPLTENQEKRLDEYLLLRETGKDFIDNFWPVIQKEKETFYNNYSVDSNKPLFSLFTNVLWDTAVFGRDRHYPGMLAWLKKTIESFQKLPSYQLVIRIHPAEVRIEKQKTRQGVFDQIQKWFPTLPKNILVIPADSPLSSYTLSELSQGVLVYATSLGMEVVGRYGLPVCVGGDVHYAQKGFTFDLNNHEDLYLFLSTCIQDTNEEKKRRQELAKRYLNLFYFDTHFEFPEVHELNKRDIKVNFKSFESLRNSQVPGRKHLITALTNSHAEGALK